MQICIINLQNAVTVTGDPDVELLLSECDLTSSLKENAVRKSKNDSVSSKRFVCSELENIMM